jgi:hypothetical protein
MIIPGDLQSFLRSAVAEDAERILMTAEKVQVTQEAYCLARDYMLLRIIQRNAQRPAAVLGITRKKLGTAKETREGVVIMASH